MKTARIVGMAVFLPIVLLVAACEPDRVHIRYVQTGSGPGQYIGYSWSGEAGGAPLEKAGSYIETMLEIDGEGIIRDARVLYWQRVDGYWTTRQSGNALVGVDFSVTPTAATVGSAYRPGSSMFSIYTVNLMSLYAAAVSPGGVAAVTLVEPLTRYRFEYRFPNGFDYGRPMKDLTLGSGLAVPTVRTAGGAWLAPSSWDELADKHVFDFHAFSHVLTDEGVFEGLTGESSVRELLERMGATFTGGRPNAMSPVYGYFGIGGWKGNYEAIAAYLIGRKSRELTSLVDWTADRYAGAINDQRHFGVDVTSGATRTAQNSFDGIAGATVRMARESTSYQRALVRAGIITENDVIIGRF